MEKMDRGSPPPVSPFAESIQNRGFSLKAFALRDMLARRELIAVQAIASA
jgi:hypothetical protein